MATSARRRNPKGEGERLAEELLQATDRLLARHGSAAAVSLRGIAREAGVSAPSVYLHFRDKEAVVRAAVDRRFEELTARITAATAATRDPIAALRSGCLAYCAFALDEPGGYRVLFDADLAATDAPGTTAGAAAFLTLVEGIQGAMDAGAAPRGDAFRAATLVWGALHGLVSLRSARPAFPWAPLEDLVDDLLARVVGGASP